MHSSMQQDAITINRLVPKLKPEKNMIQSAQPPTSSFGMKESQLHTTENWTNFTIVLM